MKLSIAFATALFSYYGVRGDDDVYAYPLTRYTKYNGLGFSQEVDAGRSGYNEETWNNPGTAAIESLSYYTITEDDSSLAGSIKSLGMSEDQWDCYVNHYEDYDWEELEEYNIDGDFSLLGWSGDNWVEGGTSETDDMYWDELSDEQQKAAENLCYFEQTWNEESLEERGRHGPVGKELEELSCFSGANTVEVLGQGPTFMENLKVGDRVRSTDNKHSQVYSMAHIDRNAEMKYVQFYSSKSQSPLEISSDHLLFVNDGGIKRALEVKLGDKLNNNAVVIDIQTVKRLVCTLL